MTTLDHLFAYNDVPTPYLLSLDDDELAQYDKWLANDDSGMHRGITVTKLAASGIEDRLMVFELDNGDNKDLSWLLNYTAGFYNLSLRLL